MTNKNNEEQIQYYNTLIDLIEKYFTSKSFNTTDIDNGKDEIF